MSRTAAKIVLLGDHAVGKTSLVSRWVKATFRGDQPATIGAAFSQREVLVDGQPKKVQVWDTAGEERYHSMAPVYSQGAQGAVIVFDVTRRDSFLNIGEWVKCLSQCDTKIAIVIAGNKSDIEGREITFDDGEKFARENGYTYFDTSAKTGAGVEETFTFVAEKVLVARDQAPFLADIQGKEEAQQESGCC
jgi:small GTP-binding protein